MAGLTSGKLHLGKQVVDVVSSEKRAVMMSAIKSKNTRPEILIRKGLHFNGFRFKLHDNNLPGKPDLVLPKYNAVIQVNGCFWHGHDCHLFKWPKTREDFWKEKIDGNKKRDSIQALELKSLGWRIASVWECSLKGKEKMDYNVLIQKLSNWLIDLNSDQLNIRGNE